MFVELFLQNFVVSDITLRVVTSIMYLFNFKSEYSVMRSLYNLAFVSLYCLDLNRFVL